MSVGANCTDTYTWCHGEGDLLRCLVVERIEISSSIYSINACLFVGNAPDIEGSHRKGGLCEIEDGCDPVPSPGVLNGTSMVCPTDYFDIVGKLADFLREIVFI